MKAAVTLLTGAYLLSSVAPAFAAVVPLETEAYSVALEYAQEQGVLEPLPDGLMHSDMPISRRDLVTSIVRDVYKNDIRPDCFDRISSNLPARFTNLFTDVSLSNSSAKEICVGMFVGLVEGQPDGSFGAQATANLVDVAKVVTKAYGIAPLPNLRPQSRVPWHEPYWFALAKRNAIPETVKSRDSTLTRGEFAEIIYRLRDERPTQGFRYQPTMAKTIAQADSKTEVTDSFSYPTVTVRDSVVVSTDVRNLSSGLLLQMRTEERRLTRLEALYSSETTVRKSAIQPLPDSLNLY
ncbi:MAG: hypothetical protein KBA40_01160 [Candidatus Peribacteraceae bacterium]|nr:hypothetical protein [Candidatus Peribacteraceae bacterium]MBP9850099.1 hypothetical protein [Candidatus Peribacteraceae bacterium]